MNIYSKFLSITFVLCVTVIGCKESKHLNDTIRKSSNSGFDMEGEFIDGSIPNGKIKYYVKQTNTHVATREFKNGILHGPSINYFEGRKVQVVHFENGLEEGFAYIFDSLNNYLKYKNYYFHGRQIGPSYIFDSTGAISDFTFVNFEHENLFSSYFDTSIKKYASDNFQKLTNFNVDKVSKNNIEQLRLFTYLIHPPKINVQYKVGFFDTNDSLVNSLLLEGNLFWEGYIDLPKPNHSPALIISVFDSLTNKDKTFINYIVSKNPASVVSYP